MKPHEASAEEIADLLALVDRDIEDSSKDLSADWRFKIAYNAALQSALAALSAAGYQPEKGGQHHFRALQSLGETIGLPTKEIALLEAYRKKRNISEYERSGTVSDADATAMREIAVKLRTRVGEWLRQHHPELIARGGS